MTGVEPPRPPVIPLPLAPPAVPAVPPALFIIVDRLEMCGTNNIKGFDGNIAAQWLAE